MNSSAGIVAFARAQHGSTLHRRVTERSESSFEKHHATHGADSCNLKRAAQQRSCMLLDDAVYKRFAVTRRVKANFAIFLRPSDPSSAMAPACASTSRILARVAPA